MGSTRLGGLHSGVKSWLSRCRWAGRGEDGQVLYRVDLTASLRLWLLRCVLGQSQGGTRCGQEDQAPNQAVVRAVSRLWLSTR